MQSKRAHLARLSAHGRGLIGRRHWVDLQEGAHCTQKPLMPQEPRRHGPLHVQRVSEHTRAKQRTSKTANIVVQFAHTSDARSMARAWGQDM